MQEILTVIRVYLWALFLAFLFAYVVAVIQKYYIDTDRESFEFKIESGE